MSQIQRDHDVPTALLGDELLMISHEASRYFSLNGVGTRIWELLEHPTTPERITAQLVEEYEVSADLCGRQVSDFLDVLRKRSLVRDIA